MFLTEKKLFFPTFLKFQIEMSYDLIFSGHKFNPILNQISNSFLCQD
jgi:hypothetical protein